MSVVLAIQAMAFLLWQPEQSKKVLHTSKRVLGQKGSPPNGVASTEHKKKKTQNPRSAEEEMVKGTQGDLSRTSIESSYKIKEQEKPNRKRMFLSDYPEHLVYSLLFNTRRWQRTHCFYQKKKKKANWKVDSTSTVVIDIENVV